MKLKISTLSLTEASNVYHSSYGQTHASQGLGMCYWRYKQIAVIVEANEATIEEVISARR